MAKRSNFFEWDGSVLEWSDIDSIIDRKSWAVLYGNGMSMTFYRDGFSYSKLSDEVKKIDRDSKTLLEEIVKDDNLEALLLKLSDTKDVLDCIDDSRCPPASTALSDKYTGVQKSFIETVKKLHPESIFKLNLANYKKFILRFKFVFTTNYDLLTYWALVHDIPHNAPKSAYSSFTDFFIKGKNATSLRYYSYAKDLLHGTPSHIHYLHGALHLFNLEYGQTSKISPLNSDSLFSTLLGEIESEMKKGNVPLFVSEGDSNKKNLRIQTNEYLRMCLGKLSNAQYSNIVIFGQSLAGNDAHLMSAIINNPNLKTVYYGLYIPRYDKISEDALSTLIADEVEKLRNRAHNANQRHGNRRLNVKIDIRVFIANSLSEWLYLEPDAEETPEAIY